MSVMRRPGGPGRGQALARAVTGAVMVLAAAAVLLAGLPSMVLADWTRPVGIGWSDSAEFESGLTADPAESPADLHQGLIPYELADRWASSPDPTDSGLILNPDDGAVHPDGRVFVLDAARSQIHVFDGSAWTDTFVLPGITRASGLDLAGDRLVVADIDAGLLAFFDLDGTRTGTVPGVGRPTDVAVQGDKLYIADEIGDRILVYDTAGQRLRSLGGPGDGPGELSDPSRLDVFEDGGLIILDAGNERIQLWSADGEFERQIGNSSSLPLVDVAAIDADTIAFVTLRVITRATRDGSGGTGDTGVLAQTSGPVPGGFTFVEPRPGEEFSLWTGVRQDYVTGLRLYDAASLRSPQTWFELPGPVGTFESPRRVVVARDQVYVADAWPRLQILSLDGEPRRQWAVNPFQIGPVNELAVADALYMASGDTVRRIFDAESSPLWSWSMLTDTAWLSGLAPEPSARHLVTIDLKGQRLVRLRDSGDTGELVETIPLGTPSHESFTDLDRLPDGRLLSVNRTRSALEIRSPDGTLDVRWPVRGVPLRAVPTPDGGAFVLTREGWVWGLDATGAVRAWWDAAGDAQGRRGILSDVAVTPDGRVLVADAAADEIRVYRPDPDGTAEPAPSGDGCTFIRDKWAAPPVIRLGETVGVTLTVTGECLEEGRGADIVLVMDRSGSMEGGKIQAARNAAVTFVGEMDLTVSRVGLVLFSTRATLAMSLTDSAPDLIDAVVGSGVPDGGTDIGSGIQLATEELEARGRADAEQIIVVMTDGRPEGSQVDAATAADEAKSDGIRVFSIGFGGDVDPGLMRRMASSPAEYFFAPGAAELSAIYTEIARRITGGVLARTMVITDVVPSNMVLVPDSPVPPAADYTDRVLTWDLANVRADTRLTYRLEPQETGIWPTNDFAGAEYTDGRDVRGRFVFPVPQVEVLVALEPLYLPILDKQHCRPKERHADVALVLDTSSSMAGEKLLAAKSAARRFVGSLSLPQDRGAVIGFSGDARVASRLTGDRDQLLAAVDGLEWRTGTSVDAGIRAGAAVLTEDGDGTNNPVIVLLSDGQNNAGAGPVLEAAAAARAQGITIYTVALGDDADQSTLVEVAGSPERAFVALTPDDLRAIYADIAGVIPCG